MAQRKTTFEQDLAEAADCLTHGERANWRLAELTAKRTLERGRPEKTRRGTSFPEEVTLAEWSRLVHDRSGRPFSDTTAGLYARIWRKHGGTDMAWDEAYADLRGGQSPDERMGNFNLQRGLEHATPEAKREAFEQLSQDTDVTPVVPTVVSTVVAADTAAATAAFHTIAQQREDVVKEAMSTNAPTARAVNRAWNEHKEDVARRDAERTEGILRENPGLRRHDEAWAQTEVQEELEEVLQKLRHINTDTLPRTGDLPLTNAMGQRMWLESLLGDIYAEMERIRTYVTTGRTDLNAWLAGVLGQRAGGER